MFRYCALLCGVFAMPVSGCARGIVEPLPGGSQLQSAEGHARVDTARGNLQYTSLYSFGAGGGSDGLTPESGLTRFNGALYGTTTAGGAYGQGTVFKISTAGVESVVHSFGDTPSDGTVPTSNLIAVGGKLYGTTAFGGGAGSEFFGSGTVFSLTASGRERVLYSFVGQPDGQTPNGLTQVGDTFYGTTEFGGTSGLGTVFSVTKTGIEHVLYGFRGLPDGEYPLAALEYLGGEFYGTTPNGGSASKGTVFSVTPTGNETVLYSFGKKPKESGFPESPLLAVNGTLYGTTEGGGARNRDGSVFAITPAGKETTVHSFGGQPDGRGPFAGLTNVRGSLYGTTKFGGTDDFGAVFAISPSGVESVLYSFLSQPDGENPEGGVTYVDGVLYGTTYLAGGNDNGGTVYSLSL